MQQTFYGRGKSIVGAALAGTGVLIIYADLDRAATQLSHLFGTIPTEAVGVWPTVILAASRVLQAYAFDHQQFLQGFLQHMLVSSWALLLVIAGTVLSRDVFAENVSALPKKDCGLVDLTAGRSTSK